MASRPYGLVDVRIDHVGTRQFLTSTDVQDTVFDFAKSLSEGDPRYKIERSTRKDRTVVTVLDDSADAFGHEARTGTLARMAKGRKVA